MPTSIPYDPSLVLGNVVHPEKMNLLEKISALQAPLDAAEANLNSLKSLKRSIDCTVRELLEMGTDTTELQREGESVKQEIIKAAVEYAKTKVRTTREIQKLRATIQSIHCDIESPVDYNRSELKSLPISNNSMQMNVQYFHSSSVDCELNFLGEHNALQMLQAVQQQINMQSTSHNIAGTLIISIGCTHPKGSVYDPLIIDADKALKAWNCLYPDDCISTSSLAQLLEDIHKESTPDARTLSILSGVTCASCLVAIVYILNDTSTISVDSMSTLASQIQEKIDVGAWMSPMNGEFGVSSSFATDVKNMLSTQNIQSHCSLVTMGIIPTVQPDIPQSSVIPFAELITAMEDYIKKCTSADENPGVPVNFYLKQFTRQDIVRAWVNHYYPNE